MKTKKTNKQKGEEVTVVNGIRYITEEEFPIMAESNTGHFCECCGEFKETIKIRRNKKYPDGVLITRQQFYTDNEIAELTGDFVTNDSIIAYLLSEVDDHSSMKLIGQLPIVFNWEE